MWLATVSAAPFRNVDKRVNSDLRLGRPQTCALALKLAAWPPSLRKASGVPSSTLDLRLRLYYSLRQFSNLTRKDAPHVSHLTGHARTLHHLSCYKPIASVPQKRSEGFGL